MVKFDTNKETYTVTFQGDVESYVSTIKGLLSIISNGTVFDGNELYNVCNLIDNMLPAAEQIISIEDAEILRLAKMK